MVRVRSTLLYIGSSNQICFKYNNPIGRSPVAGSVTLTPQPAYYRRIAALIVQHTDCSVLCTDIHVNVDIFIPANHALRLRYKTVATGSLPNAIFRNVNIFEIT